MNYWVITFVLSRVYVIFYGCDNLRLRSMINAEDKGQRTLACDLG